MQNLVITNSGQELIARMLSGVTTLTFTKIATSDFDYSGINLYEISELYDIKQIAFVSEVSRVDATIVEVLAAVDNRQLTEGYYIRGLGLYAEDSEGREILYGISIENEHPDYLPAFAGRTVSGTSYRLNTRVGDSSQVSLDISPAAYATVEQLRYVWDSFVGHRDQEVYSEEGVHGLRYYDERLQIYDRTSSEWIDIESGGGGIAPSNVTNVSVQSGSGRLTVAWSDPGDTVVEGQTLCTWKGTKLVMKAGAYPENVNDGTLLVDNQERDAYAENGFMITGLTNGLTYYFALFPYSDKKVVNENPANRFIGKPQAYKVMTVKIDLSNSNPETCATYADDAVDMTPGSDAWDDFFGHYPVLLKDGTENGRLNRNNFAQFEDGTDADITSGAAGDVMIAFPRKGLKISTKGDILTVSMTESPDDSDFGYYAHTRSEERRDVFYLGAYLANYSNYALRSLSGQSPKASTPIASFISYSHAKGQGYEISGFYQLLFRLAMYILKYKNLDAHSVFGSGYITSGVSKTGVTDAVGMDNMEVTDNKGTLPSARTKIFGIEDFYGHIWEYIGGVHTDSECHVYTATDNFSANIAENYTDCGQFGDNNLLGFMEKPQGTTELGFMLKEIGGSKTTYFCSGSSAAYKSAQGGAYGGSWNNNAHSIFTLQIITMNSAVNAGTRLMYL